MFACPFDACGRDDFDRPHGLRVHLIRSHGWDRDEVNEHLAAVENGDAPHVGDAIDAERIEVAGPVLDENAEANPAFGRQVGTGVLAEVTTEDAVREVLTDVVNAVAFLDGRDQAELIDSIVGDWAAEKLENDPEVRSAVGMRRARRATDA